MQNKHKQLLDKMLDTLENRFSSRTETEEVFAQIGEIAIINSLNDFVEGISNITERQEFLTLMEEGKYDDAYDILFKNGLDYEKVFQENFWGLYEETMAIA